MRGIRRFRGDAQISTWLYRVTANTAYSFLQRNKRHKVLPLSELEDLPLPDPTAERPDEAVLNAELREKLQDAIAALPPAYRTVVVLKDVYGLPHDDIAQSLGISVTACKVRLFRARRRLRDVLFEKPEKERVAI